MTDQQHKPSPNQTTEKTPPPAAPPQDPSVASPQDTVPQHGLELETIASLVRQPVDEDAFSQESACAGAVQRIKQLGHEPLTGDLGRKAAGPTDAARTAGAVPPPRQARRGGHGGRVPGTA